MTRIAFAALTAGLLATAAATFSVTPATADESGLAASHTWRKERGRVCFADHWHYGSGSGRTRKAAERDAIVAWASFVDFEYGSNWARFAKAASKKMSCSPSSSGWDCSLEARPCR